MTVVQQVLAVLSIMVVIPSAYAESETIPDPVDFSGFSGSYSRYNSPVLEMRRVSRF